MISIVYGDEPYGIEVKKRKIRDKISIPSINLNLFYEKFDAEELEYCLTFPFMEERRAVILEIDSLGALDIPNAVRLSKICRKHIRIR